MTLYRVTYLQQLRVEYLVEAESKEEAQEFAESGELYDPKEDILEEDLISIEETKQGEGDRISHIIPSIRVAETIPN